MILGIKKGVFCIPIEEINPSTSLLLRHTVQDSELRTILCFVSDRKYPPTNTPIKKRIALINPSLINFW